MRGVGLLRQRDADTAGYGRDNDRNREHAPHRSLQHRLPQILGEGLSTFAHHALPSALSQRGQCA
jgi:hypothetical protein